MILKLSNELNAGLWVPCAGLRKAGMTPEDAKKEGSDKKTNGYEIRNVEFYAEKLLLSSGPYLVVYDRRDNSVLSVLEFDDTIMQVRHRR